MIIVLFGGPSDERHVSVASAQNVAPLLDRPLCWFWAPNGAVHDVAREELLAHANPFEADYIPSRPAIWPDIEQALDTLPVEDPVFLLALHGTGGEDGSLQRLFETRGIPFTGSGSEASAIAFDKNRAKDAVRGQVPLAESIVAADADAVQRAAKQLLESSERVVLKPLAGGSSRGLYFVDRDTDLAPIVRAIAEAGIPYVVEQYLSGRELTVGVAEIDGELRALPVIEIEVDAGHSFDYAGKYLGKGTREICPALIPDALRIEAQNVAIAAHRAIGCAGYSRTDLIATESGVAFLELNTLPGLTRSSLVPQELKEAGIEFRAFLEEQIALARRRASA